MDSGAHGRRVGRFLPVAFVGAALMAGIPTAAPASTSVIVTDYVCAGEYARAVEGPVIRGTARADVLVVLPSGGEQVVRAGGGDDRVCVFGDDLVTVFGGSGDDLVVSDAGAHRLMGGPGADTLRGRGGDDILRGGRGADVLIGGRGDDVLRGGLGVDVLRGGPGSDVLHGGEAR
jgi:Ca2+-binding RTX toxin-like protein